MQRVKKALYMVISFILGIAVWAAITFNYGAAANDPERDHIELEAHYNAAKGELRLHHTKHGLTCRLCPKPKVPARPTKPKGSAL